MITEHHAEGFENFIELLESLDKDSKIVLYFCGTINEEGKNWCPDCQVADPIIQEVIKEYGDKDFKFVHVTVGSREEWKNPSCKFRTDPRFKLTSVPTLMIYDRVERLNDTECQDKENIRMLLEDV